MERLKLAYSPEILAVMKMSNIEGLKQHYRCHKDKRAKTIKTMASVTDPARLVRLQGCLDKRMEFLDERGVDDATAAVDDTADEADATEEADLKTEMVENDLYKCSCGKVLKQKKGKGWTNLMAHIISKHGFVIVPIIVHNFNCDSK